MSVTPLDLRREDIPDLSTGDRTDRLMRALNRQSQELSASLNGGLTFGEHLNATVKDATFSEFPFRVAHGLQTSPKLVWIGWAADISGGGLSPVALGGVAWTVSGADLVVSDIGNVSTGHKYRVRLVIAAG